MPKSKEPEYIQTNSGTLFFNQPETYTFRMEEIIGRLEWIFRFNAHGTYRKISVLDHSCAVALAAKMSGCCREEIRYALYHDAAEAYISDLQRPVKNYIKSDGLTALEEKILYHILQTINIDLNNLYTKSIKKIDNTMAAVEANAIFDPDVINREWIDDIFAEAGENLVNICTKAYGEYWEWRNSRKLPQTIFKEIFVGTF